MNNIFIPKTIRVGYQERSDTYTKKLAYVIYFDEKGKLRKEASWKNWCHLEDRYIDDYVRDSSGIAQVDSKGNYLVEKRLVHKNLGSNDYPNEPTEGFVLNKGVGGVRESYGWNTRNEYIRVWDPRGFEFEISIANLLYILQNTSSIKGKGLEGKFLYGWQGTDLVLIPENAPEFQEMQEFTEIQSGKIGKKDLIPGWKYLTKKNKIVTYVGEFPVYENNFRLIPKVNLLRSKSYWFYCEDEFIHSTSLNFLSSKQDADSDYPYILYKLDLNFEFNPIVDVDFEEVTRDWILRNNPKTVFVETNNFFARFEKIFWSPPETFFKTRQCYDKSTSKDDWKAGNITYGNYPTLSFDDPSIRFYTYKLTQLNDKSN